MAADRLARMQSALDTSRTFLHEKDQWMDHWLQRRLLNHSIVCQQPCAHLAPVDCMQFDLIRKRHLETDRLLDELMPRFRRPHSIVTGSLDEDHVRNLKSQLKRPDHDVLVQRFNIDFTVRDLKTLQGRTWLNDEVINMYMQMLMERSRRISSLPTIHVFSTFFFPKLKSKGFDSVRTSTRRCDPHPLRCDLVLIPLHLGGNHWAMAVVDNRSGCIAVYDSLVGRSSNYQTLFKHWIDAEIQSKVELSDLNPSHWDAGRAHGIIGDVVAIPRQQNGHDCGVFALLYALYLSVDCVFDFTQKDIVYWRQRISVEILHGLCDS